MATILELVTAACYEGNIAAPSTLVGSALDLSAQQLVHLTYATARELRAARCWPQLKRRHYFDLEPGRSLYPLPEDFYAAIPDTEFDTSTRLQMGGLTDAEWNAVAYTGLIGAAGFQFRIFGPDVNTTGSRGQFNVMPTPSESHAGAMHSFEYISETWLLPKAWVVGETGITPNTTYRSANGNIYVAGPLATRCDIAPTLGANGIAQNGGVYFQALTAPGWAASTPYLAGSYVESGGDHYFATRSGTSDVFGGPSGTGNNIVDGTVRWSYLPETTWAPHKLFAVPSYTSQDAYFYRAVAVDAAGSGVSGKTPLAHTRTVEGTDDVNRWAYVTAPYDRIISDTDRCLFDDELMIAGLKWRFLRARGLEYRDLQQEYEAHKDAAVSRWQPRMKISLVDDAPTYWGAHVREGNWSI